MSDSRDKPDHPGTARMDEMLCEYVDGTMEADVRAVFEECLQSDKEMAHEVHRLRNARSALSRYGDQREAPERAKRHLRDRLQECLHEASAHQARREAAPRSPAARSPARLKLVSAVATAFVIGLFTGGLLFGSSHHAAPPAAPASVEQHAPSSRGASSFMAFPAPRPQPAFVLPLDSSHARPSLRSAARRP